MTGDVGRARRLLLGAGVVLVVSALHGLQAHLSLPDYRLWLAVLWEVPVWLTWWALMPIIIHIARLFPLTGGVRRKHAVIHTMAALATPIAFLSISIGVRWFLASGLLQIPIVWSAFERRFLAFNTTTGVIRPSLFGFFAFPIVLYGATVVLAQALQYREELARRTLRESRLETLLAQSRLQSLRMQLQPHFLFNTLNTASALVTRDALAARRVLATLGELLRQSLAKEDQHEWALAEELTFLEGYLAIQSARFRDALQVHIAVDDGARNARVPRLLLQPLLENAIRHGGTESGVLQIAVTGQRTDDRLVFTVADNGPGCDTTPSPSAAGGIGLRNTRERLRQLYGDAARLTLGPVATGGALATITMPFVPVDEAFVPRP